MTCNYCENREFEKRMASSCLFIHLFKTCSDGVSNKLSLDVAETSLLPRFRSATHFYCVVPPRTFNINFSILLFAIISENGHKKQ